MQKTKMSSYFLPEYPQKTETRKGPSYFAELPRQPIKPHLHALTSR